MTRPPSRWSRRLRDAWFDVEDIVDTARYRFASWRHLRGDLQGEQPDKVSNRGEIVSGALVGALVAGAVLAVVLPQHGVAAHVRQAMTAHATHPTQLAHARPVAPHIPRPADFAGQDASNDAREVADWVSDSRDNRGTPFAILDKREARLHVFDRDGRLIDSSRVLLGATPGDDSADGIGSKAMTDVRQAEKTTPAGRFVSQPGTNAGGEEVIWVDYHNAVSMHRVRIVDPKEHRLQRLASGDASQRRISFGCINVPVAFFDSVLKPNLGGARAVVYVLPEKKQLHEVFPVYALEDRYPGWRRDTPLALNLRDAATLR